MKANSTIWVLIILAALGAYTFLFERGKAGEPGGAQPLSRVLGMDAGRVWKVQIDRVGDPLWLVGEKSGKARKWRIEKPINAAADAEEVNRIVKELADTMVDRVLTQNIANLKPFGLDAPTWEITLSADDGTTQTLLVGGKGPGGSDLYLKPKDRNQVLVMPGYGIEALQSKKADELRDKTVIAFNKDDVQRLELTSGTQTINVERAGADAWQLTAPVKAKAKKDKVDSILMSFQSLKGSKIVEDNPKDLAKYGLDKPQAKVSVWVRGESAPRVALLGKKDEKTSDLYAKAEGGTTVFAVYSYVLNDAQATLDDLKEPEPVKEEKKPLNAPPAPGMLPANAPAANAPAAPANAAAPANTPVIVAPPAPAANAPKAPAANAPKVPAANAPAAPAAGKTAAPAPKKP